MQNAESVHRSLSLHVVLGGTGGAPPPPQRGASPEPLAQVIDPASSVKWQRVPGTMAQLVSCCPTPPVAVGIVSIPPTLALTRHLIVATLGEWNQRNREGIGQGVTWRCYGETCCCHGACAQCKPTRLPVQTKSKSPIHMCVGIRSWKPRRSMSDFMCVGICQWKNHDADGHT